MKKKPIDYLIPLAKGLIPTKYHPNAGEIYRICRSFLYIGNKFVCPCCGWHFRQFLTHGVKPRKNAKCARCDSMERHRLLWLYLKNKTNLFSVNLKVLHFAPEYIFQKILRSMSNLDYISADLDSPLAMVKVDIINILYDDNSFDVILCTHVLEHVIDDREAMKELFRVLKPGGWAILQVPILREKTFEDPTITTPEERLKYFGQEDHFRIYGLDYKQRLEKAGFSVKVDSYLTELSEDIVNRYSLMPEGVFKENIYFCSKPEKGN